MSDKPKPSGPASSGAQPLGGSAGGLGGGGGAGKAGRASPAGATDNATPAGQIPWKKIWPIPALVAGSALFIGGAYTAASRKPKPDPGAPIRKAEALVEARKFEEAIGLLNTDVKRAIDLGEAGGVTPQHRAAYHLAMARAFSGAQDQLGFSREENHQTVVKQYARAEELGAEIEGADVTRLVQSLVELGRLEDALKRVRKLALAGSAGAAGPGHHGHGGHGAQTEQDDHANAAVGHGSSGAKPEAHGSNNVDDHGEHAASAPHGAPAHDAHASTADSHAKPEKPSSSPHAAAKKAAAHAKGDHAADAHAGDAHGSASHGADSHAPTSHSKIASDGLSEVQRRIRLTKLVVEANLRSTQPRDELTLELLSELSSIPSLNADDRAWVLARQAELLIASGRAEDAIVKLLPRIRVNVNAELKPDVEGELYLLLGRAYFDVGQNDAAIRQLEAADRLLEEGSVQRAQAELLLGRIYQTLGNLEGAKERFAQVVSGYSTTPSYLPAMLGLAEVEGAVGGSGPGVGGDAAKELESSIQRYAQIVDTLKTTSEKRELTRERVSSSLMERYQDRFQAGDLPSALRFAQLAESMYPDADVPGPVHAALARTHRRIADEALASAKERGGVDFKITDLNAVERTEIKQSFLAAADHYQSLAGLLAAFDNRAYGEALWASADSYDLAGDLEQAKKAFSTYAQGASDDDPRKPEAKYRLAQVFQAQRDYTSAAGLYKSLRESKASSGPRRQGGSFWGDQSIVPLARCLLADTNPDNNEEAEGLLLSVVEGSVVAPDAAEFREALIELGRLYYHSGNRYAKAIERLSEAVRRYPTDRRRDELQYWLADSLRLSAAQIATELKQSLPQAQRQELERTRGQRLRDAMTSYERVRVALEQRPSAKLSELDRIYLRNANFYLGDCAFDLGDYDAAVKSYDAARQRYADDPASLVAMVQIVNAYVAQGRWAEARTANERAAQHLSRFPEAVWNRPDLPMERRHWERWLEARTLLDQTATADAGEGGSTERSGER